MEISQINKGLYSYIEVRRLEKISSDFEIEMLKNNQLKTISPLSSFDYDDETVLRYKVDGLCDMTKLFRRKKPDGSDVKKLFLSISDAIYELREYMLNPSNIVFDEESVLYDEKKENFRFIYVPGNETLFQKGVKSLCEEIMKHFDHSDKEGTVFFYDIYSEFLKENFTPDMFMELMKKCAGWNEKRIRGDLKKSGMNERIEMNAYEPEYNRKLNKPVLKDLYENRNGYENTNIQQISTESNENIKKQKNERTKKIILAGIVITILSVLIIAFLGSKGLKMVIVLCLAFSAYSVYKIVNKKDGKDEADRAMEELRNVPHEPVVQNYGGSIYERQDNEKNNRQKERQIFNQNNMLKNNNNIQNDSYRDISSEKTVTRLMPEFHMGLEPIMIGENAVTVGRSAKCADYMLSEPGISRSHATISKKGDSVVISDNASTNGTYINNRRIEKEHEEKLSYGDVVSFAGTEFYCL